MIRIQHVSQSFGTQVALRDIKLDVPSGSKVALLGPNGAGKTTLLRILVGLLNPSHGSVIYEEPNQKLSSRPQDMRQATSFVPETPFFFEYLSGRENLQFHSNIYGRPDSLARGLTLCEELGIIDKINQPVMAYSRGTRQKLALIRAVMVEPEYLIMDEPFNTLDPYAVDVVKNRFKMLTATIVVSSHMLGVLEGLVERLAVIRDGTLIYTGEFSSQTVASHLRVWFGDEAMEGIGE